MLNRNLPPVSTEHFSMVPRSDVPRSTFKTQHRHLTTFQTGLLIPIHVDEVLPGDVHKGQMTVFARLANLLFPLMDNVELESHFFFVPARLVWSNWRKFMGEQANPGDSIAFTIPQKVSGSSGFSVASIYDYFGLPTVGQVVGGRTISVNALPLRAYNLIWNEWYRDENLDSSLTVSLGDGPDAAVTYALQSRRKKHDYFTSCLPWPLKGGVDVGLPFTGNANVKGIAWTTAVDPTDGTPGSALESGGSAPSAWAGYLTGASIASSMFFRAAQATAGGPPQITADLSSVTATTINAIRLAVTTQQFLEKDARGGTRYTELLRSHFGVMPEDARLQRPEYIGGGRQSFQTSAIPQTSATGLTGGTTAAGSLVAQSVAGGRHEFAYHATEHGYIIGLVSVRVDNTYSQGLARLWTRQTRYDHYWPVFANLGEQGVFNHEIFAQGSATSLLPVNPVDQDGQVFGYQERWAEYRHRPSRITGMFRPSSTSNIAQWHASELFATLPALNATFIADDGAQASGPLVRCLAAGTSGNNVQVLFDSVFDISCTRCMPMFSVPGLARF